MELLPAEGFMAKIDFSVAYRIVPIHPECYSATGLQWTFSGATTPSYMFDSRLPFGASKSPYIFQKLSTSVTRMMARRGYTVISYLDDFLIIDQDEH